MAYKVRIDVGKGKHRVIMESIPLPTKKRVCRFIKRNPAIRYNTKVKVKNLKSKKITIGTRATFCRIGSDY